MGHLLLTPVVLLALCVASSGFLFDFRPPAPPPQLPPPEPNAPAGPPPPPAPTCAPGSESVAGFARCINVQHLLPAVQDNAARKCRARNQRLLTFSDLYADGEHFKAHFAKTPALRLLGARPFWVGGILPEKRTEFVTRLDNVANEKPGPFRGLFLPEVRRIRASDVKEACYDLLCGDRSQANLNRCPSLNNRCLTFRPARNVFDVINCNAKAVFICEDDEGGAANNVWSEFYSVRPPIPAGEIETLPMHIRRIFAQKGRCICRRPLDVRCREVGKTELLTENNAQGIKFTLTPTAGFSCLQRLQKRGVTCPDVELSFLCPKEEDTCDSPGAQEGCKQRGLECINRCGAGHFCRRAPRRTGDPGAGQCCLGADQDRCYNTGICSASGDPHYMTFDGVKIDYMGPCTYTLVESVSVTADCPAFIVEAENRPKPGRRPTWLKTIVLKYKGHRVELRQKKVVTVDDSEVNLPYESPDDAFHIRNRGSGASDYLVLRTDFCLVIRWDGDRKVKVEAPTSCKTRVRGLCGNWNGNKQDDWTMKNGDLANAKLNSAKRATELGNSWEVPNPNGVPGRCKTQELLECNKAQQTRFGAKTSCGMLLDRDGPFKPYLDQPRGLDFLTELHESCMDDACNSDEADVCSALQKAEDELMEAFGGEVAEGWRETANCPGRCPDKMFFNPTMTTCQPTCQDDPDDDDVASVECADPVTFPGCQCEDGLVLSGTDCVPRSQCGCSSPEGYIMAGQEIVSQDCKLRYRCVKLNTGNVQLKREPFGSCSRFADCKARNCVCKPGYSGNGKNCQAEKVKCPAGYRMSGSMCYRFFYTRKTWMEAQEVCGCGSGGEAQLCAAHTDAHVTFLNEAFPRSKLALWAAGNTMAETAVLNVTLQTTPSKAFKRPQEAGCYVFLRGKSGLQPDVKDCNLKLPFCCQVDPLANKDLKPEWTPYFLPWETPDGGSAYNTREAIKRGDLLCPTPSQLDCLTVDGKSWKDTGVGAQCNPQRGFLCRGKRCPKFKVRGMCYPDVDECKVLGSNACSGGQECVNCVGGFRCQCPGNTIPDAGGKCIQQHKSCGKCIASGDPHYTKFGNLRFDWQGRCKYVLSQTCPFKMATAPPFPCFKVVAKNKACGGGSVACTEYVEVHIYHRCSDMALYYSDRILAVLNGDGTYSFGGKNKRKDVVDTDDLRITVNSGLRLIELTTPWGLKVTFRKWYAMVELPSESEGRMCGLCGDCANPHVYTMPDGSDVTFKGSHNVPGNIVRKVGLAYQEPDPSDPRCEPPPPITEPACTEADMARVRDNKNCGFYKDARFDVCREVADEEYENCLVDLCAFLDKPDFGQQRCNRISDLVQSCRASIGPNAPQISWRAPDFCPLTCGENEAFSVNAMADEVCGSLGETRLDGTEPVEGCVCEGGFRRDPVSGMCVDDQDCGCTVTFVLPPGGPSEMLTFYLPKGQTASGNAQCKQVKCLGDDQLEEVDKTLDPVRGVCDVTTLPPTAKCQKGYKGDGFTCTVDPDECEEGWTRVQGQCLYVGGEKTTWWQAAARCAEMDAVLFNCNNKADCDATLREANVSDLVFWSRGVAELKNNAAKPLITALGVNPRTPGLENYLPAELPASLDGLEQGVLCHATANAQAQTAPKLFDCNALKNFVCLKRDPKEAKVVSPWCHSRNPNSPNQLETTSKLNNKGCKICRFPTDVECRAVEVADRSKKQADECGAEGEVLYRCTAPEGDEPPCFTKEVRGKCYPGLDECALKLAQCGPNARCVDLFYGYRCQCDPETSMEVAGKCVPYSACTLERELDGELSLSVPGQDTELRYRTRCRYTMAGYCGAAQQDKPAFRVEVAGVMSPTNPNNFANVEVSVHFAMPNDRDHVFTADKDTEPGTIQVKRGTNAARRMTLPYRVGSDEFGVTATEGDQGRIIFTIPGKDNLRVELCLGEGCETLVNVQTSADYGPGCGVCSTKNDVSFNHTEDLLEANRVVTSPVTCGRVDPPDPEPPIEPPECDQLFSTTTTCGLLDVQGGPFDGCTVDPSECVALACKYGATGMCGYLRAAIVNCPAMSAEDKETALAQSNCVPECGENMHFSAHVLSETPTCAEPEQHPATGGLPQMKCVCDANRFLHFGRCVARTDCGCVHDGRYVERGATWKSDDCSKLYKCKGDNAVEEFETACPRNSTCTGNGQCTCDPGFNGDCCLPMEEVGGKSCYRTCRGENVCTCRQGFVSQCGSCIDLNECEVQKHDCDPVTERCINMPGSFRCECASGYEKNKYTGKCSNINECQRAKEELGYELCGPNSICRDRPGHFICVCCAGYVAAGSGCVRDPSTPRPPDRECCHCMGPNCLRQGPLCYEERDGSRVDYASYKSMYERRCLEGKPVNSAKYEQGTCGNTTPRPPASHCNASICTAAQTAPPQGNAVCRLSPPREFPTVCELLIQACRDNGNKPPRNPPPFHNGPCVPADVQYSPWGPWTPCTPVEASVTCSGLGTRTRQRGVIGTTVVPEERLRQHEICNLPNCEGGTPLPVTSCGDSVYCPNTTDEVCAKVGEDGAVMTFINPCTVYMAACSTQKDHVIILHDSPCMPDEQNPSAKPCGAPLVVTQKGFRRDTGGETCVGEDVTVGTCSNSYCPTQDTTVCCRTDDFVYVTQLVSCSGGLEGNTSYNQTVVSATSCKCVDIGE